MANPLTDPLDARLRAARPPVADVSETAFDAALLERVRAHPRPATRRHRPRAFALPAAGIVSAATVAVVVLFAAGPDRVAGPASAPAAVTRALRWFDPAPGTILHIRSELTSTAPDGGRHTLVQEQWQSADRPERQRHVERDGARLVESAGDDIYDPSTNTVYEHVAPGPRQREQLSEAIERKIATAKAQGAPAKVIARLRADARKAQAGTLESGAGATQPAGDPTVRKVRLMLRDGDAVVRGRERHDGVEAWAITLTGSGGPRWTLWTAVADGRPLELRIDGGPGTPLVEGTRWTAYEVLPADRADRLLTLAGAHPDARIVRDPDEFQDALRRLFPDG